MITAQNSLLTAGRMAARSKLSAPLPTPFQIVRQQIATRIASGASALILMRGPAGFGKTTAMLQLRELSREAGIATAWLTLDDADNDLARFLNFLSQSLTALGGHARMADSKASATDEADEAGNLAVSIIESVADLPTPFMLFLDDCEALREPVVLGMLARVIRSLPEGGRIVMGSRTVPDVGLGRLRAMGLLTEVDSELLRFSVAEAQDFFMRRRGQALQPEQIKRLHQSTEGWIAAISLASMALEQRQDVDPFISSFSGSNTTIADYLAEDVLRGLSDPLRDFLLKTSTLDELSEPLCNAVCGHDNSRELLLQLERANLFLIPLDEQRQWYRYHSLFGSFLRSQAKVRFSGQLPALHRAAADWYLTQERPIPAINHAIQTEDSDFLIPLLERHVDALLGQGRLRLLVRWLDALPAATMLRSPRLRLAHAWSVSFTRGPKEALGLIETLDPETLPPEPRAHLLAMRPTLLGMMDQIEESYEQAIDVLPTILPEYRFAHGILSQTLTNTSMIMGRFADARKFSDLARASQEGNSGHFNMILAERSEAAMELMQGHLRQATVRLRMAYDSIANSREQGSNGNAFLGVVLAEALYEADECEQAQRLLDVYVPLTRDLALPDSAISAHVLQSRMVARQGDGDRALQLLTELESTGHRLGLPRVIASARLERAHQALLRGDIRLAKSQLAASGDAVLWQRVTRQWFLANDTATLALGQLRWLIHSGAAAQALPGLKQELEVAELGQRHRRALKIRILLAEALERDGQHKLGMRMLTRALSSAAAEGFIQPFLEEGPVLAGMLRECTAMRIDAGEDLGQLSLTWLKRFEQPQPVAETVARNPSEVLTRKELQVLNLLAQGLSNNDMAAKLFVEETTVRTHLRNISAKLGADNRMQAIAIARRLGLLN